MSSGEIKFYNTEKGFGFITQEGSEDDMFFHHTGLLDKDVVEGDLVTYEVTDGKKGLQAISVQKG